jgi:hypothetical protein
MRQGRCSHRVVRLSSGYGSRPDAIKGNALTLARDA